MNDGFDPAGRLYRFTILIFVALMTVGNYFAYDSIGAIGPLLIEGMGVGRQAVGALYGAYSVGALVVLPVAGFLIDRYGTRAMSLVFSALIVAGAVLVAAAPTFRLMIIGRGIFGIGAESLIVCQSAILAKWFKGKELALAFGLSLTLMRLGTLFSFNTEAWFAEKFSGLTVAGVELAGWQVALWVATILCALSLACNVVYVWLERRAGGKVQLAEGPAGDKIVFSDFKRFNASYWYITLLCVTFYSAIFPYTAFSTDFIHEKWGYSVIGAGRITSIVIFASMILSPILGGVVDRIGRRGTMMLYGSLLLVPCYLLLGLTHFTPAVPMAAVGLAFSLVPAALWPAIPLIVEEKAVGTAFGLTTWIQNWGLFLAPIGIGYLRDTTQTYTAGMVVFASLGLFGFVFGVLLKQADARAGSALEQAHAAAG